MSAIQRCLKENIIENARANTPPLPPGQNSNLEPCLEEVVQHVQVITGSFFYYLFPQLAKNVKNYNSKKGAQLLKIKGFFLAHVYSDAAVAIKQGPPPPPPEEVVVALASAEKSELLVPL